jgi:hypothetical protein
MFIKKKTGYSLTIVTILALVLLLTPILTGFALANTQVQNEVNSTCSACANKELVDFAKAKFGISANVLPDDIAQGYINTVKISSAFINQQLAFGDKVKAIRVNPQDIVQVYGLARGSDNTVIAAFLDAITGKLISVTTLTWDGLGDNNNVITTKHHQNGEKTVYNNTWKELKVNKANKIQKLKDYMSQNGGLVASTDPELVAIDWQYWCCQFASVVACGSGCLVFVEIPPLMATCDLMCQQIWSANLCN